MADLRTHVAHCFRGHKANVWAETNAEWVGWDNLGKRLRMICLLAGRMTEEVNVSARSGVESWPGV